MQKPRGLSAESPLGCVFLTQIDRLHPARYRHSHQHSEAAMAITTRKFGWFWDREVTAVALSNASGMEAEVLTYGGIVRTLLVPGKNGRDDVVLGFDSLADYLAGHPFFGAIAGRVANRIHNGHFTLNGKPCQLAVNEPATGQHLHGGVRGFDKYVWDAETHAGASTLVLRRHSPHGEEGYPGDLDVECRIALDDDNGLTFAFTVTAGGQDTVANLVNHGYYNLGGHGAGSIAPHRLRIHATAVTPVNDRLIPTGTVTPVAGTPYDFTTLVPLETRQRELQAQNPETCFDVNYVLDRTIDDGDGLFRAVEFHHPGTNRTMLVSTDLPGVQFYDAAKLAVHSPGKGGAAYGPCAGACFETQFFPDAPNQPAFPSCVVPAGKSRTSTTVYRFSW